MRGPLSLKEREDATLTNAHAGRPIGLYHRMPLPYFAWNMAKGTVPSCRRLAAPASNHCVSGSVDNHNSTNSIYQAINGYSMPFNSTQFNIIQYYSESIKSPPPGPFDRSHSLENTEGCRMLTERFHFPRIPCSLAS